MKSFFKVCTIEEVLTIIDGFFELESETIPLENALNRVVCKPVVSSEDVPTFSRSTMDGYAVKAKDTFGASENLPALFDVAGEVLMGAKPDFTITTGKTARIWTGGMLPEGSDAVVMVEYARTVDENTVELARPAAPYENVIRRGEDVKRGDVIIPAGKRLRPQDIGLLAALGYDTIEAARKPRVAVVSTGDEVIPVSEKPEPGQIRDINTFSISGLIEEAGGTPRRYPLVKDDKKQLRDTVARGMEENDLVVLSGGSSVGVRDYTIDIFNSFEGSEILFHGVSISPGKPTIMARCGSRSLWGLPGHPVSAMITCELFVKPLIRKLAGETVMVKWGKKVSARMARSVPSVHGRQDYVRVRLEHNGNGIIAHPVLGKSGLISTMVKADGLLCIGLNEEGVPKDKEVEIILFD